MIDDILAKVFGTKNKREIKAIQPIIAAINDLEPQIQQLSDIDLAAKTIEFKEKLGQGAPLDDLLIEAFAVVREAGRRFLNMCLFAGGSRDRGQLRSGARVRGVDEQGAGAVKGGGDGEG